MKLKVFSIVYFILFSTCVLAQHQVSGRVTLANTTMPLAQVEVYNKATGVLAKTNDKGFYEFTTNKKQFTIVFFSYEYKVVEQELIVNGNKTLNVSLEPLGESLSEVEISARKAKVFEVSRLKDVEETAIYAGKKTEVVLVDQSLANLASNNARQIYSQVAGLNIFQNDDAGLQLNIGGRGLDPNRTSNFNTRQNGYDISADVLGYPESYYTPPAEALKEIQIVRGAASLQYGTQFGGLVNFKFKEPIEGKTIQLITRNTIGSNSLFTNFTSLSGTKGKFNYYTFFNYKMGDGFRENSAFNSKNIFTHFGYEFNPKTELTLELTYLNYLAQQAGGLTDKMFYDNPFQSNRSRNWFGVDWLLYNVKFKHEFSKQNIFTASFFGLQAKRNALGFRINRVDQNDIPDSFTGKYGERDLIKGQFKNFGTELRWLNHYTLVKKKAIYLLGAKFYKANNTSEQGPGSNGSDKNFDFKLNDFPYYKNQSAYENPNLNVSLFGEHILYVTDKISITPGFRAEYIKTESHGYVRNIIIKDGTDIVLLDETNREDAAKERQFLLLGIGASYKPSHLFEMYGNVSQNYRSVTFSDINVVNPVFLIDPNINDENGYTLDLGVRGNWKKYLSYNANVFGLFYNDRIGFVPSKQNDGSVKNKRGNIGDARIYGVESLFDINLKRVLFLDNNNYGASVFFNTSAINSEYIKSQEAGVKGKKVEFIPEFNFKMGCKFSHKNLQMSLQYTYLSSQFTDATNAQVEKNGTTAVIGEIPEYTILDGAINYTYKRFKLETGVNNILNATYFTRRAKGYPGPGIIPSSPRNIYATLQVKI